MLAICISYVKNVLQYWSHVNTVSCKDAKLGPKSVKNHPKGDLEGPKQKAEEKDPGSNRRRHGVIHQEVYFGTVSLNVRKDVFMPFVATFVKTF